jgi:hypothetical protein
MRRFAKKGRKERTTDDTDKAPMNKERGNTNLLDGDGYVTQEICDLLFSYFL